MAQVLVAGFHGFSDGVILSRVIAAVSAGARRFGCQLLPLVVVDRQRSPPGLDAIVIGGLPKDDLLAQLRAAAPRLVSRWRQHRDVGVPAAAFDEMAYGDLGVRYLAERVSGDIWYVGRAGRWWGRERIAGMTAACDERHRRLRTIEIDEPVDTWQPQATWPDLRRRLAEIAPGSGVLCANDHTARVVLEQLCSLGRRIPDEVQVLGIDDDALAPGAGLSSICHPWQELGDALTDLLFGRVPGGLRLVRPVQVAARETTGGGGQAALAQRFQELGGQGVITSVAAMARELGCSRRYLELAVRRHLGDSPGSWLRRVRLDLARERLAAGSSRAEAMRLAGYRSRSGFHGGLRGSFRRHKA